MGRISFQLLLLQTTTMSMLLGVYLPEVARVLVGRESVFHCKLGLIRSKAEDVYGSWQHGHNKVMRS